MNLSRHSEVINPYICKKEINVIGVGAIGSHVANNLIRLGFNKIKCYDFDKVEEHNVPNQLYTLKHVGMNKVDAMRQIAGEIVGNTERDFSFEHMKVSKRYLEKNPMRGYVFICTDTMSSRHSLVERLLKEEDIPPKLIIETRMGKDSGYIFSVTHEDYDFWLSKSNYTDEETEVSACGNSITVGPTAQLLASMATWQFIKHLNGNLNESDKRIGIITQDIWEILGEPQDVI